MNILRGVKRSPPQVKIAVIGAGIAGATCAHALTAAGVSVQVIDKSRGAGGRLSTRRLEWLDAQGQRRIAKVDHGAPAFAATDPAFVQFLEAAAAPGALARWTPVLAPASRPLQDAGALWLPTPDMPLLCRGLLHGIPTTGSFAVDRLQQGPLGWQIGAAGSALPGHFDAVVLALPPAQAAPLLQPHRRDWAQRASLALMQPCWTLMGVSRRPARDLPWDVARPDEGPLAWVMRNEARPGREATVDETHWVAHARAGWSRQHREQSADAVQRELQTALQDVLGEPIEWQHVAVHRWRYAMPPPSAAASVRPCWWDGVRGLGVCGDFVGGTGVEGAWQSANALTEALLRDVAPAPPQPDASRTDHRIQRAAA